MGIKQLLYVSPFLELRFNNIFKHFANDQNEGKFAPFLDVRRLKISF